MRLAMMGTVDDDFLVLAKQLGATDVMGGRGLGLPTHKGYYELEELVERRNRIENAGLRLAALAGVPSDWTDKIKLGLPGRNEQIDNYCKTIRNLGAAGFDLLGWKHTLPSKNGQFGLRTSQTTRGRGGASVTGFDYDDVEGTTAECWDPPAHEPIETTDEQMWDNVTYFLKAVVPVAEQAGVRLALHPDDPPVSPVAGIARIFRSHSSLKRLIEIVPSDSNGIGFCQGTMSEMAEDVFDAIRYFGSRNKIFYVHFRNVTGPVPTFSETFLDEGYVDMLEAMRAYRDIGFDGPIIDDHVPHVVGDSPRQERSHAYAMGYMKALRDVVVRGA